MRRRRQPEPVPAGPEWQVVSDFHHTIASDVADQLAEIDRRVQRIAADRPEGGDLNTLATAIHILIDCIRELHGTT
ncbi:MAG: hypothetical protein ABSA31_00615 [Acidimicrobiales bacterium]|jgi:hypothetical protein